MHIPKNRWYSNDDEKIAMVTLLLKKGANPNTKWRYGDHPIDRLVEKNLTELFNLFISYKADPFVFDEYGNNLLISASEVEMLKTLLALGMDVNHYNKAKETPILKAWEYRTLEIVKTLIEAGANPLL